MKVLTGSPIRQLSLIFTVLILSLSITAQSDYQSDKLKLVAKEIITDAGICSLTTVDEDGIARSRAMDPFPVEDDFTIWMGTNANSRKVKQIRNDNRVNLYYITSNKSGYVVIYGEADLINTHLQKEKYWKPEWKDFYSVNKKNYLLIKVTPISMEVLSPKHGVNNDQKTWKPPVVKF